MSDATLPTPKGNRGYLAEHGHNAVFTFTPSDDDLSLRAKAIRAKKAKKAGSLQILNWWPVVVGLGLACIGSEVQGIVHELGDWATRFVLPLPTMIYQANIVASLDLPQNLSLIAVEVQFPLDGLLLRASLKHGNSLLLATLQVFLVHLAAALVLWLTTLHGLR